MDSKRCIIHVDMDAFYAAVEVRDDPSLEGKPLVIGSLPHERGVVATCSYEARVFGVRSGMSIKQAYRLCPHGIYMHPNFSKYVEASRRFHEIWEIYTDLVEYVSLDEGYLDVSRSAHLFGGAANIGRDIKARTLEKVGLTCSVGIGYGMMSAKIASEEDKPDGFFEIADAEALNKLIIDRNVRIIYGIGAQTANLLEKSGIFTVRDILANESRVKNLLGKHGSGVVALANGVDSRRVATRAKSKSIGREHTFQENIHDFEYLRDALRVIAKGLSFKIRMKGMACKTVTIKVTFADMRQITRSKSKGKIDTTAEIFAIASELLDKIERRPVRLVGISLSGFDVEPAEQISLFGGSNEAQMKKDALENVMLRLQHKYGLEKILTAREKLAYKNIGGYEIDEDSFNKRI